MIRPGAICPRRDTDSEIYVAILSSATHIEAETGRVFVCPFIPGELPEGVMAFDVTVPTPTGLLLPELTQWLPVSALDEPIGNTGPQALTRATSLVASLLGWP
ncbi:toxin [Nocardia heshunensis]